MDRKSIIILLAAVALYFALSPVIDHLFPPKLVPVSSLKPTNSPSALAPSNHTVNYATNSSAPPSAAPSPSAPAPSPSGPVKPEQLLTLSNADLILHFTSYGGGIKDVELPNYPAVIRPPGQPVPESNQLACLNRNAPLPVLAVWGNDMSAVGDFTLSRKGDTVRAEKTFDSGLRVVKEFEIGTNYLFKARLWIENTTGQALRMPERNVVIGTATAIGPLDDPTAMGTYWYNGVKHDKILDAWFANRTLGCLPGTPRWHYDEGSSNIVWAAVHNQFFALAVIPSNPAPQVVIDKIRVAEPDLSGPTNSVSAFLTNGYETAFVYPAAALSPHQSVEAEFTIYAGPKEYNRLAKIAQDMDNNLDLIMDFTGIFGKVSEAMLLTMNGLHTLLGSPYWLNIVLITVILKLVFWPLTNASTKSQKRMQALQPQLKAITDKYKDDAVKRNEKTMEFYKQHKINPMGSCLPTLLQLPVFIGFYYMLRGAIELRGAHFLWAWDLSQPDTVLMVAGFPINPLPLIMGATQLWQSHMMPPSPGMDPGQQKLMRWMPLMMIAFFYRMSAGLTLYWTVSNLLSILQMKVTKANEPAAAGTVPAPAQVPAKKRK